MGLYPWISSNKNYIDEDTDSYVNNNSCVAFSKNDYYLLQRYECLMKKNVLCGIPNELCYAENWDNWYGETGNFSDCMLKEESAYKNRVIINTDKQWVNNNGELVIEYVFKMNQINIHSGIVVIAIYNFPESVCDYYYIGISVEWYKKKLFIMRYYETIQNEIYSVYINERDEAEVNMFYILNIKIINGTYFDIKLNNIQYILFNDSLLFNDKTNVNKPQSDIPGFIGLANYNLYVHSKSLYVSGSPLYMYYDSNKTDIMDKFVQCPLPSTATPISNLSTTATALDITESHIICMDISFEYDSDQTNINNVTKNILDIINNVKCTQTIKETIRDDHAVNVALMDKQIIIKSGQIFVCRNNTNELLAKYIQNINGISKKQIFLNCSWFGWFESTQNMESVIAYEFTELYIAVAIGVFACCIVGVSIIWYQSNVSTNMTKKNEYENQMSAISGLFSNTIYIYVISNQRHEKGNAIKQ